MQSVVRLNQSKVEMRRCILEDLKRMTSDQAQAKSMELQKKLKNHLIGQGGLWAAFQPLLTEPQIQWSAFSEKIQWCFPKLTIDGQLQFKKNVHRFVKNNLGFLEPESGETVDLEDLRGAIVPGLGFDNHGNRLGRGRGYYDQTLKNFKGLLIGVCYQSSLMEFIPTEDHDLKCHFIITDEKIVTV